MRPIQIYDTTLRDGEQAPGAALDMEQKLAIAFELQNMGVDTIEAGFPAASEKDAQAVSEIARLSTETRIAAFARTAIKDIEIAIQALRYANTPRIILVMPSSDLHLHGKLRIKYAEALTMLSVMVKLARKSCAEVEVIAEDSTRSNPLFLRELYKTSVSSGADCFTLADTVGYATPNDIKDYFGILHETDLNGRIPTLGIHCHDDLGMATINTLTGLECGANQAHCTVNGIGERAGNAALEEIVMALSVRADRFPFKHNLDTTKLWPLSRMVSEMTNFVIPPNKAIVGSNAYSHGAGLHQDGMLKNVNMYEIITPENVGAPDRTLPITRHSGRKGLSARLNDLNIKLDPSQLNNLYDNLQEALAEHKLLSDTDLLKEVSRMSNK